MELCPVVQDMELCPVVALKTVLKYVGKSSIRRSGASFAFDNNVELPYNSMAIEAVR